MSFRYFAFAVVMSLGLAPPVLAGLDDGLVAYYPFDGNANDASGNGNHGTVHGATLTEDRFGNAEGAYSFDGDDYIKVPNFTLNPNEDFTFSLWVFFHEIHSTGILFNRERAYELAIFMEECSLRQCDNDEIIHSKEFAFAVQEDWDWYSMNYTANENEALLVTMVYDSSNNRVLSYINGALTSSDEIGHDTSSIINDFLCIASRGNCDSSFFTGVLDDFRVYNRALSECEIQSLYTGEDECNENELDHFLCYKVKPSGNFKKRKVLVHDQFGSMEMLVIKPNLLCTPAALE
jgi:hypothetical protein